MATTEYKEFSTRFYILFDTPPAWFVGSPKAWRYEIANILTNIASKELFYIINTRCKEEKVIDLLDEYLED